MLLPLSCMVVKECFMGVTGLLVIKRTGNVFGADWHGKAATVLLYTTMILHVFWEGIPVHVSDVLIGASTAMVLVSLALYGRHNIRLIWK